MAKSIDEAGGGKGCGHLLFGFIFVSGLLMCGLGFLRPSPPLTLVSGVVLACKPSYDGAGPHTVAYDYVVHGTHHQGQHFFRSWWPSYRVGDSFPVYLETDHPERNYGPSPPRPYALKAAGIAWTLLGIFLMIVFRVKASPPG